LEVLPWNLSAGNEESHKYPHLLAGYPVSGPRVEPRTSQLQVQRVIGTRTQSHGDAYEEYYFMVCGAM
jgi:hypothetical protein